MLNYDFCVSISVGGEQTQKRTETILYSIYRKRVGTVNCRKRIALLLRFFVGFLKLFCSKIHWHSTAASGAANETMVKDALDKELV